MYPDTEHVKFRTLPEVTVASCTYQGSYTPVPKRPGPSLILMRPPN